jgi:adenine deaminase
MELGRGGRVLKRKAVSKPDLLITGGRILNIYTGEILPGDVVIHTPLIHYVGPPGEPSKGAREIIHADGSYVIPGFFDPHAHTDILFNPATFSNQVILSGTTSVFSDSHDLANSLGFSGFKEILRDSEKYPLKFFSGVPAASPPFPEIEGNELYSTNQFRALIKHPSILGISEIPSWNRIVHGNPDLIAKIRLARRLGKRVEGHTLGASYESLSQLAYEGVTSCHEALKWEDALVRLRLGLFVMIRHGSIRSDLEALSPLFKEKRRLSLDRVMLTPDTRSATDIMADGYMDCLVREAVRHGIDPTPAIRMVTLNPARYFGLDHLLGGIAPGRIADVLLVKDLAHPTPHLVVERGRLAVREGDLKIPPAPSPARGFGERPFLITSVRKAWLDLPTSQTGRTRVPAIHVLNKTVTGRREVTLSIKDGMIQPDPNQDILKICLIQRDGKRVGKGLLSGFGLKGAVATSISHEVHNLMVIGDDPEDMRLAADKVLQLGGGIVLARNGHVLSTLLLPIGGIMSALSMPDLCRDLEKVKRAFGEMGSSLEDPLLTMGFLSFTSILDLRITVSGVYSVKEERVVF